MHRIDTPTAQKDKFGAGKNGFTRGNPQTGTPATALDDDYFDMLQEELAGVVEAAGITLDKSKHNQLLHALSGRLINVQSFTASGTYTPSVGTKFVIVEVLGGGGGGSNAATPSSGAAAGAGGSSGAYGICKHTPTGPVSVVVGAGGAGGIATPSGADGSSGGATSYDTVTAPGGSGGPRGIAVNVFPTGGGVSSGSLGVTGSVIVSSPGTCGQYGILYSNSNGTGGSGGNSIYGAGGISRTINASGAGTSQGANGAGYGSGGGGAVSVNTSTAVSSRGGNGSPGVVIIWEYA